MHGPGLAVAAASIDSIGVLWSFVGWGFLLTALAETLGGIMTYTDLRAVKYKRYARHTNYIALSSDEPVSDADYAVLRAKLRRRIKRGGIAACSIFGGLGMFAAVGFFFAGSDSGTNPVLYALIALPLVALWTAMVTAPPVLLVYRMERNHLDWRHARAGQSA